MIKFKSVQYSNIMSVGNTPITVDLEAANKTLITGTNGAGKSTFIEAICFSLYGKPFRNIKKTQIVNAVNKKKLVVEIVFQNNKHVYKVIRGIKPNKFEIYKDDELIPQDAAVADYQDMLEKDILKMSLSTFKQIAVLGTAGYTPFMLLPAAKRREIVEDLLDIGIFSDMAALNKVELKTLTDRIRDTEAEVERKMGELKLHVEFQKQQQENRDGDLVQLEERQTVATDELNELEPDISKLRIDIDSLQTELSELKDKLRTALELAKTEQTKELDDLSSNHSKRLLDSKEAHISELDALKETQDASQTKLEVKLDKELQSLDEKHNKSIVDFDDETRDNTPEANDELISELASTIMTNKTELERLKKNRSFYEEHSDCPCPTCEQPISQKFASEFLELADKQISELNDQTKEVVGKLKTERDAKEERLRYIDDRSNQRKELESSNRNERGECVNKHAKLRNELIKEHQAANELMRNKHSDIIQQLTSEYNTSRDEMTSLHEGINNDIANADVDKRDSISSKLVGLNSELSGMMSRKTSLENSISVIVSDIEDVRRKAATEDRSKLIKELSSEVRDVKSALQNDMQTRHCRKIVGTLLKDDGVKSMIVRQYIPMINKYINEYLQIMNANYNFVLDEEFNETIKSRGRDDFSYTSFSQGERCRIDLALLFAFRDLVGARTGSMTNLLVFDEILDGPSDTDAVEAFNTILGSVDSNVFVISHSDKHDQSAYNAHLKFHKRGNFTRLVGE